MLCSRVRAPRSESETLLALPVAAKYSGLATGPPPAAAPARPQRREPGGFLQDNRGDILFTLRVHIIPSLRSSSLQGFVPATAEGSSSALQVSPCRCVPRPAPSVRVVMVTRRCCWRLEPVPNITECYRCNALRAHHAAVELETKVHPKVRNHGEGPY